MELSLQDADLISFSSGSTTLLITVLVIFSLLSVPVTSVVSSVIQLTNITLISLYWLISKPCLRVRTITLVRRLCCSVVSRVSLLLLCREHWIEGLK